MTILFSSSDDCRWPKIQFEKQEKMFFVSREFLRFVNFTFFQHFVIIFIIFVVFWMIFNTYWPYFCFLVVFWLSILFQQFNYWFSAKMRKSKKYQKTNILTWIMKKWYDFFVFPHDFLFFDN